ncbi:MAG: PLP-dependent lyase/thiolase [Vicinamibacterales bacterium]
MSSTREPSDDLVDGWHDGFVCGGCGARVAAEQLIASRFHCPHFAAGDARDHVLEPSRPPDTTSHPEEDATFLRYRSRLTAYRLAKARGTPDDRIRAWIAEFDARVAGIDGSGFVPTPLVRSPELARAVGLSASGSVWVKDETTNVSGSHKARHLAGIMLFLEIASRLGIDGASEAARAALAIASCGNAALAAAVIARAARRPLRVFVPTTASPRVTTRLRALAADVVVCERQAGETGDPCYHRFHDAVSSGALPFCCQGPDNALTLEGGQTLVWELLDQLGAVPLDRLFVQVGGGALASACARGLAAVSPASRQPRLHAVQAQGGFPLVRAWALVARQALEHEARRCSGAPSAPITLPEHVRRALNALAAVRGDDAEGVGRAVAVKQADLAAVASHLSEPARRTDVRAALEAAAAQRGANMWPWECEPVSRAHGILDDETYDWRRVVAGMLESGGWPIVVTEAEIERANEEGRARTGIDVDHTGSAGLAGAMVLSDRLRAGGCVMRTDEHVAVIFSGVRR